MKIVGREREIAVLEHCFESRKPEFLAVYGRRRVGKTFLIEEYYKQSIVFAFTGSAKASRATQLSNFRFALKDYGMDSPPEIGDWGAAFRALKQLVSTSKVKRKVVFIDELPWLATQKSDFVSALEHFWNSWGSGQPDLLLVVCGSATSWIIDNIIHDHGGLYGRVTRQLFIKPFSLSDCEAYFEERGIVLSRYQIAELYMMLGGIPYYLDYVDKGASPAQCIDRMFFVKHAPLAREFEDLFASLFRRPERYLQVVEALATNTAGMTREALRESTGLPSGGQLSKTLRELEQCGFIESTRDFSKKANDASYKIVDFFTLFYVKHIRGNQTGDERYWQNLHRKGGAYAWYGLAFERLCKAHADQIKQRIGILGVSTRISAWRSRRSTPAAQIDLVIDREDGVINLCEMKFSLKPFVIDRDYDARIRERTETFRAETRTTKALHTTFVTTYGLSKSGYNGEVQSVVTLDDLFRPLLG